MARTKQPKKKIHQMTVSQWEAAFPDEAHCAAYLVKMRWPDGVIVCPRCGSYDKVSAVSTMENRWQCYACTPDSGYRFSHIAGTIFENTNKPLRDWFRVMHLMLTAKKGISALQIMRYMDFGSYKTAWCMCHRIRAALAKRDPDALGGIVEVDETYVGGKAENKHKDKRGGGGSGGIGSGKIPVIGAIRRKGNVVLRVIDNTDTATLDGFVRQAVSTNTIEGFWAIIKRGVMGSFHKVSRKYMPLYVAEFQFRYNNRENDDIFGAAVRSC